MKIKGYADFLLRKEYENRGGIDSLQYKFLRRKHIFKNLTKKELNKFGREEERNVQAYQYLVDQDLIEPKPKDKEFDYFRFTKRGVKYARDRYVNDPLSKFLFALEELEDRIDLILDKSFGKNTPIRNLIRAVTDVFVGLVMLTLMLLPISFGAYLGFSLVKHILEFFI
jgi:hypothetical protein